VGAKQRRKNRPKVKLIHANEKINKKRRETNRSANVTFYSSSHPDNSSAAYLVVDEMAPKIPACVVAANPAAPAL
jgi:hypothetical protein